MALPLIALGASLAVSGVKAKMAADQNKRSNKIRKEAQAKRDANDRETAAEKLKALKLAESKAAESDLPGQGVLEGKFMGATGGAVSAIKEAATTSGDVASGATEAYRKLYTNPLRDLKVKAAERQDRNQQALQSQLNRVGDDRDKNWEANVNQPYQDAMQTAGALDAAGKQNTFAAVSDAVGGISNYFLNTGAGKTDTDTTSAAINVTAKTNATNPDAATVADSDTYTGDMANLNYPGIKRRTGLNTSDNNIIQYYG